MGKENPFCAWKLILVCFVYFHNVSSEAVVGEATKIKDTLIDRIRFCDTVSVIADSSYIKTCETFNYPKDFLPDNVNLALCMIVYDTTSKMCEYSSKVPVTSSGSTPLILPVSSQLLDKEIEKFESFNNRSDICKNISSIFNKLNHSKVEGYKELIPYLEHSKNELLSNENCIYTCYSTTNNHKINHLCTYLLWANEFFSLLKPIQTENNEENLPGKGIQSNTKAATPEEKHENNNEKQDPQVNDKNEPKKIDKTPNTVSEPENQHQSKLKLPTNSNKKSDDTPKNPTSDIHISNNVPKINPSIQKQVDESNNHGSLPAPPKEEDAADVVESKKNDGDVDNAHQLPPGDANPEADSISVEDQNKNENEDLEEGIDREKVDIDQKESNNPGVDTPIKSSDDNDEFQQRQKFISHSQNLKAEEESHFFTYFSIFSLLCILLYFGYHNKQKIFAILLEGRRSRRGRGSRRRPSTASYRKLDCNLEEAVTSQCNSNVTHVIY